MNKHVRMPPAAQIVTSSTFTFADTAELVEYQEKRQHSWEYGRWGRAPPAGADGRYRAAQHRPVSSCTAGSTAAVKLAQGTGARATLHIGCNAVRTPGPSRSESWSQVGPWPAGTATPPRGCWRRRLRRWRARRTAWCVPFIGWCVAFRPLAANPSWRLGDLPDPAGRHHRALHCKAAAPKLGSRCAASDGLAACSACPACAAAGERVRHGQRNHNAAGAGAGGRAHRDDHRLLPPHAAGGGCE